ncbi:hypothetical protein [Enterococcus dongliensis]|uniref:hypothetical protein n=1 Tax=Enterococcus dongliensis TaxID=2559925 RepID=UPI00289119AD|nr:hypothetical protein [Enterococcus dongliensis]MDT2670010.1 hypothetical protein [Enterococcus dongliensis]
MNEILNNYLKPGFVKFLLNELEVNGVYTLDPSVVDGFENLKALHDDLQLSDEYVAFMNEYSLVIANISYKPTDEKKYLRLGLLPVDGKSFNFLTEEKENGVSVFELRDGKPVLDNLQLMDSFSGRYSFAAFYVTGEEVATGHDGEPILTNVKYDSKADIDIEKLSLEALDENFNVKSGSFDEESKTFHQFYTTGNLELTYKGFTYSEPKNGFNTEMGKERND